METLEKKTNLKGLIKEQRRFELKTPAEFMRCIILTTIDFWKEMYDFAIQAQQGRGNLVRISPVFGVVSLVQFEDTVRSLVEAAKTHPGIFGEASEISPTKKKKGVRNARKNQTVAPAMLKSPMRREEMPKNEGVKGSQVDSESDNVGGLPERASAT